MIAGPGVTITAVNYTTSGTATITINDLTTILVTDALYLDRGTTLSVSGRASINASSAVFATGSLVDGAGGGYAPGVTPGGTTVGWAGGTHAGCGGGATCYASQSAVPRAYDSFIAPILPGSGGGPGASSIH